MKFTIVLFTLSIFLITGCNNYQIPQASKEHPANLRAATSPGTEQTEVLKVDKSNLPKVPVEMQNREMKHM